MASFAHNVLKMVRKLAGSIGPPGPTSPLDATDIGEEHATGDAVMNSIASPRCFAWPSWLLMFLKAAVKGGGMLGHQGLDAQQKRPG